MGEKKVYWYAPCFQRGVSILFFVGIFLIPNLVWADCPSSGYDTVAGVCIPNSTGLSSRTVEEIALALMDWLLGILGIVGIIAFVVSGIQYFMAAGDERTIETAKRNMKYSVIGVVIAVGGRILILAISNLLSGSTVF